MGRGPGRERWGKRLKPIRAGLLWTITAIGLLPAAVRAEEPAKAAAPAKSTSATAKPAAEESALDDELLEFLGTVDSEGEDWIDYLAQTDIEKVARRGPREAAPAATEVKK